MKSVSIMIVETNTDLRNTLRHAFEDRGYLTWTCPAPEIAVSIFAAIHPSVVLLDLEVVGADPTALLDRWKEQSPKTRVITKPYTLESLFVWLEHDFPPSAPAVATVRKAAA